MGNSKRAPPPPRRNSWNSVTGPPYYRSFAISLRHTTLGRTILDDWSAPRRNLYPTTHNSHKETDIHAPDGIRTHHPSKRASSTYTARPPGIGRIWDTIHKCTDICWVAEHVSSIGSRASPHKVQAIALHAQGICRTNSESQEKFKLTFILHRWMQQYSDEHEIT